jgi:hypothetical protein
MTDTTVTTEAPATIEPTNSLERDAGYVRLADDSKEQPDALTKDEAADRLKELSGPESSIRTFNSGLPDNVAISAEEAGKMLAESREADKAQAELDATKAEQKAIDKLRGDKPAAPQVETEADIEKVLANPKIRDAIAERVTAADTRAAQYESAVADAGKFAAASLFNDFPELSNLPLNQWVSAIQAMHQREPARAQLAMSKLQALARVEQAVQQLKAQNTAREQTEFKAYAAKENARFADMTKNIPAKEMAAIEAHVPKMLAEHGADVAQFLKAVSNQSTFPRATAEALLVKAARYDLAMKAAKPSPTRTVPNVQRPGIAGPRGADRGESSLAALSNKLSRSGSLKDAVALRLARSKGR